MNKETLKKIFDEMPKRISSSIIQKEYLINGKILIWEGPRQPVISPCYGTLIGEYPMLTGEESLKALDAAEKSYPIWSKEPLEIRINCVKNFLFCMSQKREQIIDLIMWEIAKSKKDSEKEFDRTIEDVQAKIEEVKKLDRESSVPQQIDGIHAQIRRVPLGVSLIMGPYNYALNETYTLLFPALLMGNTVIFKTPKYGVLLHQPLLKSFQQCFPAGVINTLYGDGPTIIGPLMMSGRINSLGFIGTSKVADILVKQHPKPHRLRRIIGAEAKNPAIVFGHSNIDNAVKECVTGALSFNGQRCTALKILFIENKIAFEFRQKFCEAIDKLKPGYPWDTGVDLTPLPEPNKGQYLNELVTDAVEKGAILCNEDKGGGLYYRAYYHPAVLSNVNSSMRIYHEEQFGPVIPIVSFNDVREVLDYIKDSNYGQQVSIFSRDSRTVSNLINELENQVCRININTQCQRGPDSFPFTGRKDSAEGTVSNSDTFKAFSIRTMVAAKMDPTNQVLLRQIYDENSSRFMSTDYIF